MQLAFVLYKYFPFGGLQRDFMRIALECQQRGHQIRVYTLIWEGDVPPGFEVLVAPVKAFFNHRRNQHLEARWNVAFPDQRVDPNLMAALLTFQGDAHEIALQAPEWKVLVQDECQLHQRSSSASNNVLSRVATRSGFRRVKHRGHSRLRSN